MSQEVDLTIVTTAPEETSEEKGVTSTEAPEKITGYKPLTEKQIRQMNELKALGNELGVRLKALHETIDNNTAQAVIDQGNLINEYTFNLNSDPDVDMSFLKFGEELQFQTISMLMESLGNKEFQITLEFLDHVEKHIQMSFMMMLRAITKPTTFV